MVKGYNNHELDIRRVDSKLFFFYQLWKELTDKRTLDTYQFRVHNTVSLIKELIKVINQRLKQYHSSNYNIEECKKETALSIKGDSALREAFPALCGRILAHLHEKTETDSQQRALQSQLEYTLRMIEPQYLDLLFKSLEKSIDNDDRIGIKEKTNKIVSYCADKGWSVDALYEVINTLNNSRDDETTWDKFKEKLLNSNLDEYVVLLPCQNRVLNITKQNKAATKERIMEEIRELGIEVTGKAEILSQYSYLDGKLIQDHKEYLIILATAHDFYSASNQAISKIADIFNMLSFYRLIEPWSIRDIGWIVVNPSNGNYKALSPNDLFSTYDYLERANKIFSSSKNLDKMVTSVLRTKLRAAYSYANMGKASYAQAEKYMNTWVALESLCRTGLYENIISNVLETVPPALCLRYIYRLFRNFIEDCIRCRVSFDFAENPINLRYPVKSKVVEDIIKAFRENETYQEILNRCSVNDLLSERCKELHELTSDDDKLFQKIEDHYQNVRWQLSRLYRLRNEIAHSALNDGVSLIRYIEHLDDYLDTFVSEVVMCWEKNQQSSVEEIYELIKDNYQAYLDIRKIKEKADAAHLLDSLKNTGIIALL